MAIVWVPMVDVTIVTMAVLSAKISPAACPSDGSDDVPQASPVLRRAQLATFGCWPLSERGGHR